MWEGEAKNLKYRKKERKFSIKSAAGNPNNFDGSDGNSLEDIDSNVHRLLCVILTPGLNEGEMEECEGIGSEKKTFVDNHSFFDSWFMEVEGVYVCLFFFLPD